MTTALRVPALRVFFGHQSVGADLIEGLRQLNAPAAWIREDRQPSANPGSCLLHARLGRNRDPLGKLADFSNLLQDGLGRSIDLALMKFCYVDLESEAEVVPRFSAYRQCMEALSKALPDLAIGHVTVPLRSCPMGMSGVLQRMFRGAHPELARNAARDRFNAMLRDRYAARGLLFDLARIQTRRPDGETTSVRWHGQQVPVLAPELTRDGGHLNNLGCRVVAMEFVRFLERAARRLGREAP